MIGVSSWGKGFHNLSDYLTKGKEKGDPDRAEWTADRNVFYAYKEQIPSIMRATAMQNPRVEQPVYHLVLSPAREDQITREQWEQIADRVLTRLDLQDYQALLVFHRDTKTPHLHIMVNAVNPETFKPWDSWRDWVRRDEELRKIEKEMGLRQVRGPGYLLRDHERIDRSQSLTSGERWMKQRTGDEAFVEQVRRDAREHFREAESWTDLAARLRPLGLELQAKGRGLVVTDGRQEVKASRIERDASRFALEQRLGPFQAWKRDLDELRQLTAPARQSESLAVERERVTRTALKARGVVVRFEEAQAQFGRTAADFEAYLSRAYKLDNPAAVRRLAEQLQRDPRQSSVILTHEPGALAPLRGLALGPVASEARRQAVTAARQAAGLLPHLEKQRAAVRHRQRPAQAAERRIQPLAKRLVEIHDQHRALEPSEGTLWRVGQLALRLGGNRVVDLFGPAADVVRGVQRLHRELARPPSLGASLGFLSGAAGMVYRGLRALEQQRDRELDRGR